MKSAVRKRKTPRGSGSARDTRDKALARLLSSALHRKVIRFFSENETSIDTPRGVSTWVHEDRAKVVQALEDLVAAKALTAHRVSSTTGYSFTRDPGVAAAVRRALHARPQA